MLNQFFTAPYWQYESFGNTLQAYTAAFLIFVGLLITFKIFQSLILYRLKKLADKTKTDVDDTLIKIFLSLRPPFYAFLAFYLAFNTLIIHSFAKKIIAVILIIWVVYQAIKSVQILIDYLVEKAMKKDKQAGSKQIIGLISKISKGVLWALGGLLILQNLGVNVTSLIAGLGIGGIAIALALQNILGDLFSSFAILFDKPFVPGDFIIVENHKGTVEKIGIKTTRIRSVDGEEIIISNKELTSTSIQNFQKLKERRAVINFGVKYETPTAKIRQIPKMLKDIIKEIKDAKFDRAHFSKFNDSALTFEVVYFVKSDDYEKYMDVNQKILIKIKSEFEKEKIDMAYPTRTIYMAKE
ncbi:mechanosensitive ion channel family protein [Patescibacteria group bacterium]|nr:mechanosensitive ion channel family protein [Patescibacteria group bacterium]